jgi:histidinol phosphatase-like PHP family hydrolase
MGTEAFAAPGQFWRGNIHTHSTRSDGRLEPEEVCRRYREAGYDFLCLSDHFLPKYGFPITDTISFRTNSFTTILGAEVHAPSNSLGEAWHILAAGLPLDFEPTGEAETGAQLAARARAAGAFVGIAHPQWSGLTIDDGLAMIDRAHAVEIYNHGCAVECTRGDGTYLLDQLLTGGHRFTAYAADDAHFRFEDGFGGWMMVKAEANEPSALLAAMKAGLFYSSQGPVIHGFSVSSGEAVVECSPVRNVAIVGRGTRVAHQVGSDISKATLSTKQFAGDWFRLVVTDAAGKSAWSNPVWL